MVIVLVYDYGFEDFGMFRLWLSQFYSFLLMFWFWTTVLVLILWEMRNFQTFFEIIILFLRNKVEKLAD